MGVGKMCLPTSGAAVQHDVVLLREEERLNENTLMPGWVRRSSSAVVILASLKTLGHSPKARFVVRS
jgi:hypothetical protein